MAAGTGGRKEMNERCHAHARPPILRGRDEHRCSAVFFFVSVEPKPMEWCHPHSEWVSPLHLTRSRKWLTDLPELYLYGDAQPLPAKKTSHRIPFINFHTQEWASRASLCSIKLAMTANYREVSWEGCCYYRHREKRRRAGCSYVRFKPRVPDA